MKSYIGICRRGAEGFKRTNLRTNSLRNFLVLIRFKTSYTTLLRARCPFHNQKKKQGHGNFSNVALP